MLASHDAHCLNKELMESRYGASATLFEGCNHSMAQSMLAYTHQNVTGDGQEGLHPPHAVRPP